MTPVFIRAWLSNGVFQCLCPHTNVEGAIIGHVALSVDAALLGEELDEEMDFEEWVSDGCPGWME
jgi:hypothetical protein